MEERAGTRESSLCFVFSLQGVYIPMQGLPEGSSNHGAMVPRTRTLGHTHTPDLEPLASVSWDREPFRGLSPLFVSWPWHRGSAPTDGSTAPVGGLFTFCMDKKNHKINLPLCNHFKNNDGPRLQSSN